MMDIDVLYKFSCTKCSKVNIGQKNLYVYDHIKQHTDDLMHEGKSAAADRMIHNHNHYIDFQ